MKDSLQCPVLPDQASNLGNNHCVCADPKHNRVNKEKVKPGAETVTVDGKKTKKG